MNKQNLLDVNGKPLTQSLFLELNYSKSAVYTLKDNDYAYKGVTLPSIKRIYLDMEDTTEYEFANECFLGWQHWQRICANKACLNYIEQWREELELKLKARAVRQMIQQAESGSFQAVKWLADKGYDTRTAGRPTKEEKERHLKVQDKLDAEFGADVKRLREVN